MEIMSEEETSSSDDSSDSDSDNSDNDGVPLQLDQNVPQSHFLGEIKVSNSRGIHCGNKVIYNGPITVNKFISNVGERITTKESTGVNNVTTTEQQYSINLQQSGNNSNLRNRFENKKLKLFALLLGVVILFITTCVIVFTLFSESDGSKYSNVNKSHQKIIKGIMGTAPYYERNDWLAAPNSNQMAFHRLPLNFVIICHTDTQECFTESQCISQVYILQKFYKKEKKWEDIAYNFLIGGDGGIYEGRGWDTVGAIAVSHNARSIGISVIGNFMHKLPTEKQMTAIKIIIEEGIRLNKISANYILLGQCQVTGLKSPGTKFYEELIKWDHWSSAFV